MPSHSLMSSRHSFGSCASGVRSDRRVREMAAVLESKADDQGRFAAESMYRAYKDYDFANKKQPSPTLTVAILHILNRLEAGS